jgi:predicted metal-binding membrane protein
MLSMQMYGTMGMAPGPFLFFWTLMMAAMMFPALAPIVSIQFEILHRQTPDLVSRSLCLGLFLLGYLCVWFLFGLPVFFLCVLADRLVLYMPTGGIVFGALLLIMAGLYQITPLKQHCLSHCNPTIGQQMGCTLVASSPKSLSAARSGLLHGLFCLGCCGHLMLILVAVGLMNLSWMVVITLLIFLEKVWHRGPLLSLFLGSSRSLIPRSFLVCISGTSERGNDGHPRNRQPLTSPF